MTDENSIGRKPSEKIEVETGDAALIIRNIPSDDNSPFSLSLMYGQASREGDIVISLQNHYGKIEDYLGSILFRSSSGAGYSKDIFPSIADELSTVFDSFIRHGGKIPSSRRKGKKLEERFRQKLTLSFLRVPSPYGSKMGLEQGEEPNNSYCIIKGLQDNDCDEGPRNFLDVEIANEGNVIITQRCIRPKLRTDRNQEIEYTEIQGQMLFKTAENGGRYPIMAEVFTRFAEKIIKSYLNSQKK